MQISTKGKYALRAMIDLTLHMDQGPVLRVERVDTVEVTILDEPWNWERFANRTGSEATRKGFLRH